MSFHFNNKVFRYHLKYTTSTLRLFFKPLQTVPEKKNHSKISSKNTKSKIWKIKKHNRLSLQFKIAIIQRFMPHNRLCLQFKNHHNRLAHNFFYM